MAQQGSAMQTCNKLVFVPNGRLGNAIFRYMACAIVNIINPALEYTLAADFQESATPFTYYPGVDHEGDDAGQSRDKSAPELQAEAMKKEYVLGYNTLGYFKHTLDLGAVKSNAYINKHNGHGLYVKNTLTLQDTNFFALFYKKLEYFNIRMEGYFQFGYIYLKYKPQILNYIEKHKNKHIIQTDIKERFLMADIVDDMLLPPEKQYDVAIHIRLGDFNGRPDFIELEHYLRLFDSLQDSFQDQKICLIYQPTLHPADASYIRECLAWFTAHAIPICVESNALLVDFNIMKQARTLICSMSTLAWTAAYLSNQLQQCYMPNYNFFATDRQSFFFHKPIENTILYPVKTTPPLIAQIKPYIVTLPAYAARLAKLDSLNQQFALLGLEPTVYEGVYGKDVRVSDALSAATGIKHITWRDTTYFYDTRVRLNGVAMLHGEFGCAWSHLNLLRQMVATQDANYYLVLEDDVELVKPLTELYELLQHIPADADLCHLAKSEYYPFAYTRQVNPYFYECKKRYFNKTTAYLVSAKGAQKILDYANNSINVPIDDLFNMIFRLTPDFRFYVPATFFFKEQENVASCIIDIA